METSPAVSVLSLVSPKLTGINCDCSASEISSIVKSPSGPINIKASDDLGKSLSNNF